MKNTGIVRKVDQLGRIVIPRETRKVLNIKEDETNLEIYIDGEQIILKKYEPACIFCGEASNTIIYKNKRVCKKCAKSIMKEK